MRCLENIEISKIIPIKKKRKFKFIRLKQKESQVVSFVQKILLYKLVYK
jgi:hypothetical protein